MSDIALNDAGDIDLTGGLLHVVYDADYRAQRMRIALRHRMGEWFRDQGAGTDYDAMMGKSTELSRRAELRRRVLEVPGIAEITSLRSDLDRATRALTIEIECVQDNGEPLELVFTGRA